MNNSSFLFLQSQHSLMHEMMERINEGFFVTDKDWKVVLWNSAAESIIGKKRTEVLGRSLWECFPDAVQLKYYRCYTHALEKQVPVHFEEYYPPLQLWTEVSAFPSDTGLAVYFKKGQQKKNEQDVDRLLAMVAKETVLAVSLIDFDGTTTWVNEAFTRITGYTAEEVIGKKQSAFLLGPESDEATVEELRQAFYKHLPFEGEVLCYTKSKVPKWLFVSAQPIYDETTGVYKYFFIQNDITEQKNTIQQLEAHRRKSTAAIIRAQEKERSLIGQELHDNVNQVLTSVKLFVELCRDSSEKREELLTRSSTLLQEVIDELRSISHQLAVPAPEEVSLAESISQLAKNFADTRRFEIELHTASIEKLKVRDELQRTAYRVLQEHLLNVLKHAEASLVEIHASIVDQELIIKVIDNGKGFDLKAGRSGIGLLNIRNRVESINGTVVINSKPGLGCVLIASLPLN